MTHNQDRVCLVTYKAGSITNVRRLTLSPHLLRTLQTLFAGPSGHQRRAAFSHHEDPDDDFRHGRRLASVDIRSRRFTMKRICFLMIVLLLLLSSLAQAATYYVAT